MDEKLLVGRLIVECGNTDICITNSLIKPISQEEIYKQLHPSQFGYKVGRLTFDNFGCALYRVWR